MVRVLAIGDPHGDLSKVKQMDFEGVDLILLTGDIGKSDLMRKIAFGEKKETPANKQKAVLQAHKSAIRLVGYLRKKASVWLIFGNVELSNRRVREISSEIGRDLPFLYNELASMPNVRILNNRIGNFKGVRIAGLRFFAERGWVERFIGTDEKLMRKANADERKAASALEWFSKYPIDVLLCHQPPLGILDVVDNENVPDGWNGKHAGSPLIKDYIMRSSPGYVVCGHIHEGAGTKKINKTIVHNLGECGHVFLEF